MQMTHLQSLIRALRERGTPVAICLCTIFAVESATDAATVTPHVQVNFNGTLSGLTYGLGAGELDTTGTFAANGSATISGGMADLPGDVDATSGFYFNSASLGALTTQNWIAEIVFSPDVATANQPGPFNNFLDVQGDTYFRFNGNGQPKAPQFGFFDGTIESIDTTVSAIATNEFSHLALTWTAASNTLEAYLDGVSQGTLSTGTPYSVPGSRVGFGFFARDGFIGRAVDGKLDAVAFSTFTGTFNSGTDFQLVAPPPPLTATVNRDTAGNLGNVTLSNVSGASFPIAGYSVTSTNGALSRPNWNTVTGKLDAPGGNGGGNGSIDPDDDWVILSDANSEVELSEYEINFPGGNGGTLGVGASLNLGSVWRKVPGTLEDVVLTVTDPAGNVKFVPVTYTGNGGNSFPIGDLDFNGDVNVTDWQSYLAAARSDLTGLTIAEAYRMGGDLNSDGTSDLGDLDAFLTSYDTLHGSGAFADMVAGVPEPSAIVLLTIAAASTICFRMRRASMKRSHNGSYWWHGIRQVKRAAIVFVCLGFLCGVAQVTSAATVTRRVFINFNGTLPSGNTYTLGPGELDTTLTFRKNGGATIANGVAEIPGNVDASSGFLFNSIGLPTLTTTNWVTETVMVPDVPAAQQPPGTPSNNFNHFLDVRGDLFYRYNGNTVGQPKITQFGYWDGATEPTMTTPDFPTNKFSHVALTWTASNNTLEAFVDGVSQGTVSTGNAFATPSANIGYGFFSRGGFFNRAIDGKLASVAFSTFTGTFNPGFGPGFDFQLDPTDAPSLALDLVVNTVSGSMSIVNNTLSAISIRGYEVASAMGSLDVTSNGWRSLQDQNIDPVMGGDAPGETWQEGANPSSQGFFEGFLLGSTTLGVGQSLSLGRAYDELIGAEDLGFRYRLAGQSGLVSGLITYDDTPPPPLNGDYNNNGVVDTADYTVWRNNLGSMTNLPNDTTPGSVIPADYGVWKSNFGATAGAGAGAQSDAASAVPEPASQLLLLAAIGMISSAFAFRRNKY